MSLKARPSSSGPTSTRPGWPTKLSVVRLHADVAKGALADAGLAKSDIDGYFCAGDAPGLGTTTVAEYLGLKLRHVDSTECGGSAPILHVAHAAAAIAAGRCNVALITLAGRPRAAMAEASARAGGKAPLALKAPDPDAPELAFELPYGPATQNLYAHGGQAPHARVRHHERAARVDQGGRVAPCAAQRARDAAQRRDGGRGRELADGERPAAPARLLRDERRRRRPHRRAARRSRANSKRAARDGARHRRGAQAFDGRQDRPHVFRGGLVGAGSLRRSRRDAGGHPVRLALRQLHDHRADAARGPGLLPRRARAAASWRTAT